jgi:hypothetical protein
MSPGEDPVWELEARLCHHATSSPCDVRECHCHLPKLDPKKEHFRIASYIEGLTLSPTAHQTVLPVDPVDRPSLRRASGEMSGPTPVSTFGPRRPRLWRLKPLTGMAEPAALSPVLGRAEGASQHIEPGSSRPCRRAFFVILCQVKSPWWRRERPQVQGGANGVLYTSGPYRSGRRGGVFKIMQLLPAHGGDYQYRIESADELHDRVVKENELD